MTTNRVSGQFRAPQRSSLLPTHREDVDFLTSQYEGAASKAKHIRWTEIMDELLIQSLLTQVLGAPKRGDNGFSSATLKPVVDYVNEGCCGVCIAEKNVRARLKTLKKEYVDVHELLKISGFGLCPLTGRVTADPLVWEEYIRGKPDGAKMKGRHCAYYDELEAIFGNDTATGENAHSGCDNFPPFSVTEENDVDLEGDAVEVETQAPSSTPSTTSKRSIPGGVPKARRRRSQANDGDAALTLIAESSVKIVKCMEVQVNIDLQKHINWQGILDKLQAMNMAPPDIKYMIKLFEGDNGLARVFMGFTNFDFSWEWAFEKLDTLRPSPFP